MSNLQYGVHNPNLAQHLAKGREALKQSEAELKAQEKDNRSADQKLADAMALLK
jgi:hypothetical protein